MLNKINAEVPRAFLPLLKPARHKGAFGGRGSGKSHHFAEQMILRCFSRETRAVCLREIQNTLKESVRQLLIDKIAKFGLGDYFSVLEAEIRGRNGSLIIFRGMQSFNAESIKSLEGFDIAWVEEAQTLSARSLRLLRPTIRKPGSELWYSWNARYDSDAVDAFFRGGHAPPDSVCVRVNWNENPWFPDVLAAEREYDLLDDPEMAEHVWDGGYENITEGSYYARLIAAAENEGRIGDFPYDPALRLRTGWDIGIDDYTAIWFLQDKDQCVTVVDYYEASNEGAPEIVANCMPELLPELRDQVAGLANIGREVPFKYNLHFLPHDVKVREWGGGGKERTQTLNGLGVKPINVGVADKGGDRINATRALLPITRFNNTKRVQTGLKRLRRYSRKWNESMKSFSGPLHDGASHGADAFGEYAVNCGILKSTPIRKHIPRDRWVRNDDDSGDNWKTA
jgi:phage terminase large subunit